MGNTNVALLVTDKLGNAAILSGINDDENAWVETSSNLYTHRDIGFIQVEIKSEKDKTTYKYSIQCKDAMYIQIMTSDLSMGLSSRVEINSLFNILMQDEDVEILSNTDNEKYVRLNIDGIQLDIKQTDTILMRGMRRTLEIIM